MTVLAANPSNLLVIGMGLGTVFIGLICIIVICYVMGAVIKLFEPRKREQAAQSAPEAPAEAMNEQNKGELVAVISAVIAEELGESVEAIRIKSIRRVS